MGVIKPLKRAGGDAPALLDGKLPLGGDRPVNLADLDARYGSPYAWRISGSDTAAAMCRAYITLLKSCVAEASARVLPQTRR